MLRELAGHERDEVARVRHVVPPVHGAPPAVRRLSATSVPFDSANILAGTVAITSHVAFTFGGSKHGNQPRLSSSWPCVHACSGCAG